MSPPVRVRVLNMAQFQGALKRVSDEVRGQSLVAACYAGAETGINFIKLSIDASGLHRRSGNLVSSVTVDAVQVSGNKASITFGPHTVYAAIHEFGGIIRATKAPYLVFEVNGQLVITKSVQIPARPYLRPAMDRHGDEMVEAAKRTLVRILEGLNYV